MDSLVFKYYLWFTPQLAAFVLPILNKLCKGKSSKINTIIVSPTRELAMQIDRQIEGFSYFTNSSSFPIYGGGTPPLIQP
ncbi:DEAD/DEAH box helicase [bacterium]|nr:DEAD/DEAH box helicase [bacterium]